MQKMRRLLALLLAMAVLCASMGLAEELGEAEVVEGVEVEEPAPEEAEEAAEPPEEEPAADPVEAPAEEPEVNGEAGANEDEPSAAVEDLGDDASLGQFDFIVDPCDDGDGHEFNAKGKCIYCNYQCKHESTYVEFRWKDKYGIGDPKGSFSCIDAQKHLFRGSYNCVVTRCVDCGNAIKKETVKPAKEYVVEQKHVYLREAKAGEADTDEAPYCWECGYEPDANCAHELLETAQWDEVQSCEPDPDDKRMHIKTVVHHPAAQICRACGAVIEAGEGETEVLVERHTHGGGALDDEDWNEGLSLDENQSHIRINCEECGFQYDSNSDGHEHQWEAFEEKRAPYYRVNANDYANHTRVVDTYRGEWCKICGIHRSMKRDANPATAQEPHAWVDGVCKLCGMSQMCNHPKEKKVSTIYAANLPNSGAASAAKAIFVAVDDDCHRIVTEILQEIRCAVCDQFLRYDSLGKKTVFLERHSYHWKTHKCQLCGYACKHEGGTESFFDGFSDCEPVDYRTHRVVPDEKARLERYCKSCSALISNKKTSESYVEEHSFEWSDSKGAYVCDICGYALDCPHANVEIVTRYEENAVSNRLNCFRNTGDPETHFFTGVGRKYAICSDCGQLTVGAGESEKSYTYHGETYPIKLADGNYPHRFVNGVCEECGYANVSTAATALKIQSKLKIGVGEKWTPDVNVMPMNATGLQYKSSKKSIFEVDPNTGEITGKKAGSAKLTVTCGKLRANCTVTVTKKVTEIKGLPKNLELGVGERWTPSITLAPKKSYAHLRWSGEGECVEVDPETGAVRTVAPGAATITASALDGAVTASCAVTVKAAPASISSVAIELGKGEKRSIALEMTGANGEAAAGAVRLASSNPAIVAASSNQLTAKKASGTATITAFAYNGAHESFQVTLKSAPKGLTLQENGVNLGTKKAMKVGDSLTVVATLSAGSASKLDCATDKDAVATIEPVPGKPNEFVIRALAKGKAKITISTFNKKKKAITITVTE